MIPMRNIHPLTDFKRRTSEFRLRLKNTGLPEVLTVDGRADLVVQSADAYQKLLEAVERAEAIEGVRRGLASMARGEGRPVEEFDAAMRRKHRIPRKP
jgi:PHD/YefM family antitoxin component YafN of YafNO toxin-antitoxin module